MGSARLESIGVRFASVLARALPETAARRLGTGIGRAAFAAGIRRRVTLENLARAFGTDLNDHERRDRARGAYAHLGASFIEFLRLPDADVAWFAAHSHIEGLVHAEAALARGQGAIVASGHLGNWELGGASIAAAGLPVTFVVQRLSNPSVDAFVDGVRRGAGIETVERGALRGLHRALAANRLVFIMYDQDARRRGVFVPFFGVPASTPAGAARLALRLGVPLLCAFSQRTPVGAHHTRIEPAIAPPAAVGEDEAVVAMLGEFNRRLERAVRAAPEQYWWAHRRWKTAAPATGSGLEIAGAAPVG